jgi:hypothetical protein
VTLFLLLPLEQIWYTTPAPEILKLFPIVNVVEAAPRVLPAIVAVMVE